MLKSYFETSEELTDENSLEEIGLSVHCTFQFENQGNAPTDITDLVATIEYDEDRMDRILNLYPFLKPALKYSEFNTRVSNYDEYPVKIGANGSTRIEAEFEFNNVRFAILRAAAGFVIDLRNPQKRDWKELPIFVKVKARTTNQTISKELYIQRKDLADEDLRGPLDFE